MNNRVKKVYGSIKGLFISIIAVWALVIMLFIILGVDDDEKYEYIIFAAILIFIASIILVYEICGCLLKNMILNKGKLIKGRIIKKWGGPAYTKVTVEYKDNNKVKKASFSYREYFIYRYAISERVATKHKVGDEVDIYVYKGYAYNDYSDPNAEDD